MERFKSLTELITYHLHLHEGLELRDIYKLAHQWVFGPEHLGEALTEHAIREEMHRAGIDSEEPLVEPISVDASACRINLRPAGNRGIAPGLIAEAVRHSAGKFSRDTDALSHLWCDVRGSLKNLPKEFSEEEYERLTRLVREKGFPPLHHSHSYRKCNRPAYRVVIRQELERLMRPFSDGAL